MSQHSTPGENGNDGTASGKLGLLGVMMPGLAQVGPFFNILFSTVLVAGLVGVSTPLVYLIAMFGIGATANSFAQFSHKYPSSGSFVTFITRALGAPVGVVTGVVAMLGYVIAFGGIYVFVGDYIRQNLLGDAQFTGATALITVAYGVLVLLPAILGLSFGMRTTIALYIVEIVVLAVFVIGVLIQGGKDGLSLLPLTLHGVADPKSLALALSLTVLAYGGFEAAAPFAEETANPRRNVPIALLANVAISGLVYVLGSYALVIAFGVDHVDTMIKDPNPFVTAGHAFVPFVAVAVSWVFMSSITSSYIAANLETSRVIAAGARGGLWWGGLSRLHPKFGTPWVAVVGFVVPSVAIGVLSTLFTDPGTAAGFLGTYGTIGFLLMYMVTNVALVVEWVKDRRAGERGHVFSRLISPVVGVLVLVIPFWGDFQPGQAAPYSYLPVLTVLLILAGVAYMLVLRSRKPHVMDRAAALLSGEEIDEETAPAAG
ncbi:APC family permease [Streptomyces sp. NPDC000987]|uniref:APC family permease n=1 Tax=Streptomyces sp. NPDC000987 TaxID=3154374 RepID=UPI0033171CC7